MLNFIRPSRQRGLSLIELMIAMVAGLIVSGAALALVISMMKSNAETIKATRLTQELRATAEIIGRDLRRARSVSDPIGNVDVATKVNGCNTISPAASNSATCVTFAYDCTSTGGEFKAIGLAGNKVRLLTSATSTPACPTASTGTQLSSDAIKINSFNVSASATGDAYTVRLTGQFANDPSSTPLIRSFSQEVRIRSAAVN
jgi:prepilin-type N-terminal cleavage/methylation domain-containing protein